MDSGSTVGISTTSIEFSTLSETEVPYRKKGSSAGTMGTCFDLRVLRMCYRGVEYLVIEWDCYCFSFAGRSKYLLKDSLTGEATDGIG